MAVGEWHICTQPKSYLPTLVVFFFLTFVLHSWAIVDLPLEIFGAEGTIVSADISLSGTPSSDLRLQATCHNLSYEDKGSVRVNGGPWILLNNGTVKCHETDAKFACLGGPLATLRFNVALTGQVLKTGTNRIEFRYNKSDLLSIGYRVVRFNLVDAAGKPVLDSAQFRQVDPYPSTSAATPPVTADVAAGYELWYTKPLLSHNQAGAKSLRARCTDCHAQDGRDLKYFGYSQHSIIERAKFHGLTELEGEKIAAYIRSLPVVTQGRPWNPPYQPGPGLDKKPVEQWAAGAGLESVLDEDLGMLPYLFPKGVGPNSFDANASEPVRETPISLQLPDWNRWLPEVHPLDLWGDGFKNEEAFKLYQKARSDLVTIGKAKLLADGQLANVLSSFMLKAELLRRDFDINVITTIDKDTGKSNIMHWSAVKQWEMMNEFSLEDASRAVAGPKGELRSWFTKLRNVFEMAPHRAATNGTNFKGQSVLAGKYFSTSWYELQTIINPGNRNPNKLEPVDWNYQPAHIQNLGQIGVVWQPLRLTRTNLVMLQQYADLPVTSTNFGTNQIHPGHYAPDHGYFASYVNTEPVLRAELYSSILNALMDVLEKNPVENWPRRGTPGVEEERTVEPADYKPSRLSGGIEDAVHKGRWADGFLSSIYEFGAVGVDQSVLCRMSKWGKTMWSQGDWQASISGPCPEVSIRPRQSLTKLSSRKDANVSLWIRGLTHPEEANPALVQGERIDAAGRNLNVPAFP